MRTCGKDVKNFCTSSAVRGDSVRVTKECYARIGMFSESGRPRFDHRSVQVSEIEVRPPPSFR
jgi:hypothetical protein